MAAQVAQALTAERALTQSVLESQQRAADLQSQSVAQALHEQQLQTRQLAEQVARPGVTPEEMDSLRSQISQLRINSELEAAHYNRKLESERSAKHEAKRALDAMAGERAALNARLDEQRAAHTQAVAQMAELSRQNVAAHALALRQEASDAANLALQAQLTTAMAMIGDLRRRVDAGSAPASPRQTTAVPLLQPLESVGDFEDVLEDEWTQAEWEAHDLYYDEAASFGDVSDERPVLTAPEGPPVFSAAPHVNSRLLDAGSVSFLHHSGSSAPHSGSSARAQSAGKGIRGGIAELVSTAQRAQNAPLAAPRSQTAVTLLTPTRAAITPAELTDSRGRTFPKSFDQRPTWSSSYATSYVPESAENRLPAPEACFVMPSFLPAATHVLEYADSDAIPTAFGPWTTTGNGSLALFAGDRPRVKINVHCG